MEPTDASKNADGAKLVGPSALKYPVCRTCGSETVVCDAWAKWNRAAQEWELDQSFDDTFCRDCDSTQKVEWRSVAESATERTRRLNDEMRAGILTGGFEAYGTIVMTRGVADRGQSFVQRAGLAVATYDAFDTDSDPYGEHDFGAFEIDGEKLFFKVDYFSHDMQGHSSDKSDVGITNRVLTILLASEY